MTDEAEVIDITRINSVPDVLFEFGWVWEVWDSYPVPRTPQSATVSTSDIAGTDADDLLTGTRMIDVIEGGWGDDRVRGGDGNDQLYGSAGDDVIWGQNGNDRLVGGHGNDVLIGGHGNDLLAGVVGDDRLVGGAGDDTLLSGYGNNKLYGGAGNDRLLAGQGINKMYGGDGDDLLVYDSDQHILYFVAPEGTHHAGPDYAIMTGGAGADTFQFLDDPPRQHDIVGLIPSTLGGRHLIKDFDSAEDTLDLSASGAIGGAVQRGSVADLFGVDTLADLDLDLFLQATGFQLSENRHGHTMIQTEDRSFRLTVKHNGLEDIEAEDVQIAAIFTEDMLLF